MKNVTIEEVEACKKKLDETIIKCKEDNKKLRIIYREKEDRMYEISDNFYLNDETDIELETLEKEVDDIYDKISDNYSKVDSIFKEYTILRNKFSKQKKI